MRSAVLVVAAVVFGTALVHPALLWAQAAGAITGIVSDQSGAVIPGVTIDVTNTATGQVRTAVTGIDGYYTVLQLPPGP